MKNHVLSGKLQSSLTEKMLKFFEKFSQVEKLKIMLVDFFPSMLKATYLSVHLQTALDIKTKTALISSLTYIHH